MFAGVADPVDLLGDRLQPWPPIFIGKGLAGAHLGDVARGVKPVAILVAPAQSLRQPFPDGALARAGHAHHDQRAWHSPDVIGHEDSPEAQPDPRARLSRPWNARGLRPGSRPPAA